MQHSNITLAPLRYTPSLNSVYPGLSSASYLSGSNLVSTGTQVIPSAGVVSATYPTSAGYVSGNLLAARGHSAAAGGLLHSGIVSSPYPNAAYVSSAAGHYGAGSKIIAGNGLYAANGLYSGNGLLTTSGLR